MANYQVVLYLFPLYTDQSSGTSYNSTNSYFCGSNPRGQYLNDLLTFWENDLKFTDEEIATFMLTFPKFVKTRRANILNSNSTLT